jgi:hypothetical protein
MRNSALRKEDKYQKAEDGRLREENRWQKTED